jgi:hypothetical protein
VPGVSAPCVGNHIKRAVHLTERLNPLFTIVIAGIDGLDNLRVRENQGGFQKIDFANLQIFLTFASIP